jgi:hypothetical protein
MEQNQGLSQGSLRNSHRETHAVQRKPAAASLQNLAIKVLEGSLDDLVIRQRLDTAQAEPFLKRAPFFVLENEGRAEPGYLICMPEKPAVYLQWRRGKSGGGSYIGYTLRLRLSSYVSEGGGSVLVATLDDITHSLRFEDVVVWRGTNLARSQPYSKRREVLKQFIESHWVPDARLLGGIFASVAQPMSLEAFQAKHDWNGVYSVDFIPETAGKRRYYVQIENRQDVQVGPAGLKQNRIVVSRPAAPTNPVVSVAQPVPAPAPAAPAAQPAAASRKARAVPVDKMPDVYDLYGEDGLPISRASVQQFALSQLLRKKIQEGSAIWVTAGWRAEFGGYEIQALAANN